MNMFQSCKSLGDSFGESLTKLSISISVIVDTLIVQLLVPLIFFFFCKTRCVKADTNLVDAVDNDEGLQRS